MGIVVTSEADALVNLCSLRISARMPIISTDMLAAPAQLPKKFQGERYILSRHNCVY
jgi:hypothetical protein